MSVLSRWLQHPLTRDLELDDPRTTELRHRIVQEKKFLRRIYEEWYGLLVAHLSGLDDILELGSGAGFLKDFIPSLITSDVFETPGVDRVVDARRLPFQDDSLDAIVMIDVFHHLPEVNLFFEEAKRCLRDGGKIIMVEPWRTPWSEWVYQRLHHEPFVPDAEDWRLPLGGPLSEANGALPWIVFERDCVRFASNHPEFEVRAIQPIMPIAYLLSGGISLRALVPGWVYPIVRILERFLGERQHAMFALVALEYRSRLPSAP